MSRASVIVSLLIAAGLTALSLVTVRPATSAAAERVIVLQLDPAQVTELSVVRDGVERRVQRGRLPGQWIVHTGAAAWPIAPERMRAALRVLAELRGAPAEEVPGAGAPTLRIARADGEPLTLRISPPGLGGRRLIGVVGSGGEVRGYQVDDWLHEAFIGAGPDQWRARSAMPGVSLEASRLTLATQQMRIAISRGGGRWGLTAPVGAPASEQAVEALLGLLSQLGIMRFYDEAPAEAITGLDEPVATIRIERDMQIPEGAGMRRITEVVTLEVGAPTDTTMSSLFARVTIDSSLEGAPRGQAIMAISAEALNRINPRPEAYIAETAAQAPASEIGALGLAPADGAESIVTLERAAEGWLVRAGPRDGAQLSADQSAALGEALRTICQRPAGAVLIEAPEGYTPQLRIELRSLGGSPLAIVDMGSMPAPQQAGTGMFLVIRSGQVWRVYESQTLPALDLLASFLPAPAGPEALPAEASEPPAGAEPAPEGAGGG
ncbi:MAG: hypothetical protein ACF8R7_00955 [Phycisphaerales bacterium JB039]